MSRADRQAEQSRASVRVEARPPTGQGHIVGARGFATQSGSVTICQITKIENNFQAQERDRQSERKRGERGGSSEEKRERAQPALRSDFCPGSAAIVFITSLAQLHFTLKHLSLRELLLSSPALSHIFTPSTPEPCYVYIQCGLISKLFPACAFSLRVCLAEANKAITSARTSQD